MVARIVNVKKVMVNFYIPFKDCSRYTKNVGLSFSYYSQVHYVCVLRKISHWLKTCYKDAFDICTHETHTAFTPATFY